jgi:hypothetical protein
LIRLIKNVQVSISAILDLAGLVKNEIGIALLESITTRHQLIRNCNTIVAIVKKQNCK